MKKNGKREHAQRYRCTYCGFQFQGKRRPKHAYLNLWNEYVWGKQTLDQLSNTYGIDIKTVQKRLDAVKRKRDPISPRSLVFVADVSFFSRGDGVLVVRSPKLRRNIVWSFVKGENPSVYRDARSILESEGFVFLGVVLDGRKGVREVFSDIPVQMCHFHQKQILRRYLTLKPKLEAGQELLALGKTLPFSKEVDFASLLEEWFFRWEDFLKEKTYADDGKHFHYTHKKIRSAYHSLRNNLPYPFTFQRYPELHMPNTTNSLDGYFSQMKKLLRVHNGLSEERRNKVVEAILNGENERKTKKSASRKYH